MPSVVGVDLSSRFIDLVKLEEDSNRAEWVRCELAGADAWERVLNVHARGLQGSGRGHITDPFWEDVYLVAIEAPYGSGQPGTLAKLNRVVGAIAASLPGELRHPSRCWIVRPDEWKAGLGLKGKPTWEEVARLGGDEVVDLPEGRWVDVQQNFRDAYCLAMWARDENARAVTAALKATT